MSFSEYIIKLRKSFYLISLIFIFLFTFIIGYLLNNFKDNQNNYQLNLLNKSKIVDLQGRIKIMEERVSNHLVSYHITPILDEMNKYNQLIKINTKNVILNKLYSLDKNLTVNFHDIKNSLIVTFRFKSNKSYKELSDQIFKMNIDYSDFKVNLNSDKIWIAYKNDIEQNHKIKLEGVNQSYSSFKNFYRENKNLLKNLPNPEKLTIQEFVSQKAFPKFVDEDNYQMIVSQLINDEFNELMNDRKISEIEKLKNEKLVMLNEIMLNELENEDEQSMKQKELIYQIRNEIVELNYFKELIKFGVNDELIRNDENVGSLAFDKQNLNFVGVKKMYYNWWFNFTDDLQKINSIKNKEILGMNNTRNIINSLVQSIEKPFEIESFNKAENNNNLTYYIYYFIALLLSIGIIMIFLIFNFFLNPISKKY